MNIIYTRVSTSKQAADGVSLEMQREKMERYAELNDIEHPIVMMDSGISGKSLDRPQFQEVLNFIKSGVVKNILVYSLSRLSRSTKDLIELIELFEKHNIKFHSFTEKVDTSSPTGRFFITILGALSQLEREQIAERTRNALKHKKSNGEKCGGYVPDGFNVMRGELIRNENEQEAIEYMTQLKRDGFSLRNICRSLKHRGFKTKQGSDYWTATTINRILERV